AHLARKFGLQATAFAVESPESTAPAGTAGRLVDAVRTQGIPAVFTEYGNDSGIMTQVAGEAGVPVCTLYADIVAPEMSYEDMMRANTTEIVRCLGD
ncbi:MAG TPA: metal ABC transporter substrate-binding protein, partial [Dehalococcoidia bacterium]|nr:metal ABC transporter substrate-binding protein [Dehalococcoidia bacterium]